MHFILYNRFFEIFIYATFFINLIINGAIPSKEKEDKEEVEEGKKEKKENISIFLFKTITKIIYIIILTILLIHYSIKFNFTIIFLGLYYSSFISGVIKTRKKNFNELSYESKSYYINTLMIYWLLFSSHSTKAYITHLSFLPYSLKEYLIIIFLIMKLVFFSFCVITNTLILLSNISIIFNKKLHLIKGKIEKIFFHPFNLKTYNFLFLKKKQRKWLLVDIPLYIIVCPLLLIYNYITPIFILLGRCFFKKCFIFIKMFNNYLNNSSRTIPKSIKISTIISLIIIYLIIIYSKNTISEEAKDFYNLIITVILIPLIYDSIKQK